MSSKPDSSLSEGGIPTRDESPRGGADSRRALIGEYELRREIGRGGMGTVYEAWQESLKRTVALKVLAGRVSASSTAVARFQREAQAAAKLHHPHIIPIYAQGEEEGTYYYAMELVDGVSLNAIIAGARDCETADTAVSDLEETVGLDRTSPGDGCGEDRDCLGESDTDNPEFSDSSVMLAPSGEIFTSTEHFRNVVAHVASIADALEYAHNQGVIHRDIKPHNLMLGKDGRMRISDFGLARLIEQPGVTMTGELIGSPLYMSPEQVIESPDNIDSRTDVYSLGATLYEWLTLTPPYPGETRERVISLMLTSEPRLLRSHNAKIPVDLETICLKAMERDRDRRYQTAGALGDDLRRFLANRPIKARRANPLTRVRKFIRRHQLATLGTVALALALALGWALIYTKSEVVTQTAATEEAQEETDRILDLLSSVLPPEIGLLVPFAEAAVPVAQDIVAGGQDLTSAPGAVASGGADATLSGTPAGIAQRAVHDFYRAIRASASGPATSGEPDEFSLLLAEAFSLAEEDPQASLGRVDRCLALRFDDIEALQLRLSLLGKLARFDEMAEDAERLVGLRPDDHTAHIWRGLVYLLRGRGEGGLESLTQAMLLDVESAWAGALHGLALVQVGRAEEAFVDFDRALTRSPNLVVAILGRGAAHAAIGDFVSAAFDLTRAIEMEPDNADTLVIRGEYHIRGTNYTAALADFDRAMALAGRTPAMVFRYLIALSQQRKSGNAEAGPADQQEGADAETQPEATEFEAEPSDGVSS